MSVLGGTNVGDCASCSATVCTCGAHWLLVDCNGCLPVSQISSALTVYISSHCTPLHGMNAGNLDQRTTRWLNVVLDGDTWLPHAATQITAHTNRTHRGHINTLQRLCRCRCSGRMWCVAGCSGAVPCRAVQWPSAAVVATAGLWPPVAC